MSEIIAYFTIALIVYLINGVRKYWNCKRIVRLKNKFESWISVTCICLLLLYIFKIVQELDIATTK